MFGDPKHQHCGLCLIKCHFFLPQEELKEISQAFPMPKQLTSNQKVDEIHGKISLNGSLLFIYTATSFTKDPHAKIMVTCTSETVKWRG